MAKGPEDMSSAELRAIAYFDDDGNGALSADELSIAIQFMSFENPPTKEDIEDIFSRLLPPLAAAELDLETIGMAFLAVSKKEEANSGAANVMVKDLAKMSKEQSNAAIFFRELMQYMQRALEPASSTLMPLGHNAAFTENCSNNIAKNHGLSPPELFQKLDEEKQGTLTGRAGALDDAMIVLPRIASEDWQGKSGFGDGECPTGRNFVAALKRRLNVVHGLPSRFMQKLYRRGEPGKSLDETAQVDSPMDLELVLVPYLTASETQADELLSAAEYGSASEVEAILNRPQHPDGTDEDGRSPLHHASQRGDVAIVRLLLEAGADKNLADNEGYTALMTASMQGETEVARVLLDVGADANLANNRGSTALMFSVYGGIEISRMLLAAGADKNSANNQGSTALTMASFFGFVEVARLLQDSAADEDLSDHGGDAALRLASAESHRTNVQLPEADDSRIEPPGKRHRSH
ncbi:Ankyrin repeat domain-containing protein 50 [Symbiodinium microadriaticum]|uniref:Ankyrin repeat domain-containing protein 50 n=1 Tax=Symbiodinium microadriaticum TaxID=2951 RepID=A0A1Q9EFE5_SYMMI|nr:Ankyrin repeat domain-containing protein 50 [Symbiodinium microadriaticum]